MFMWMLLLMLQVAVKKIPGAFDDLVDAKRIVREIRLLRHFDHENVMKVVDILPPSSLEDFDVSFVLCTAEWHVHRIVLGFMPFHAMSRHATPVMVRCCQIQSVSPWS